MTPQHIINRANAVLLARLRTGHTPLLKAYTNLLDPSADPLCPLCKEEPQTIKYWLWRCPRLVALAWNDSLCLESGLREKSAQSHAPQFTLIIGLFIEMAEGDAKNVNSYITTKILKFFASPSTEDTTIS